MKINLTPRQSAGASVNGTDGGWQLRLPAGSPSTYRLAQLDDYMDTRRGRFRHNPPFSLNLRARLSAPDLPGTWGFGLWNDPFGLSLGFGGRPGRLPALPQTAWFFHGSPPNWLSLQDPVPANGFFAGVFRSPSIPPLLFLPGFPVLPFLAVRAVSRFFRKFAGQVIHQEGIPVTVDVTQWHTYSIQWDVDGCRFSVDGSPVLQTACSPRPPLGLVIWIDNQYAAWRPEGKLGYGILENPYAYMEIEALETV